MKPRLRANADSHTGGPGARMIVVEHGSEDFDSVISADGGDETILVAEGAGDHPLDLPFRVVGRLTLLERGQRPVGRGVLLVAPRFDAESVAARELIARSILAHMRAAGRGELTLSGDGANVDMRSELLKLVETLILEHQESPVTMRVQFRAEPVPVARATRRRSAWSTEQARSRTAS